VVRYNLQEQSSMSGRFLTKITPQEIRHGRLFLVVGVPNRIIRDTALSSKKLASLSGDGERLFWRLVMVADDYGRFDADIPVVLAACFPRQFHKIKPKHLSAWLKELVKAGLVIHYSVNGDEIGQIYNWIQRVRANKSKFPPSDDGHMTVICQSSAGPYEELGTTELGTTEHGSPPLRGFEDFWKSYPKKKNKGDAEKAWKALRPDDALVVRILTSVAAQAKSLDWRKDGGKWIPYPASWIRGQRWEDALDTHYRLEDELPPAI
jgi:hypothetical protein